MVAKEIRLEDNIVMVDQDNALQDFFYEYYSQQDFSGWLKRIEHIADKLQKLKTDKTKRRHLIELYATYMQLSEILMINMMIVAGRENTILEGMFSRSDEILDFVKKTENSLQFKKWILEHYAFGINEKESIKNYQNKLDEHLSILSEVMSDYNLDAQFLNAYKHGFRVRGNTNESVYTVRTSDGQSFPLAKFDSSLTYYTREKKDSKHFVIYENTLAFNHARVIIKSMLISSLLENMQKIITAQGTKENEVLLTHFYFSNKEMWNRSYGNGRFKSDILMQVKK